MRSLEEMPRGPYAAWIRRGKEEAAQAGDQVVRDGLVPDHSRPMRFDHSHAAAGSTFYLPGPAVFSCQGPPRVPLLRRYSPEALLTRCQMGRRLVDG